MAMHLAKRQLIAVGLSIILLVGLGGWLRLRLIERSAVRTNQALGFDAYYYYVSAAEALLAGQGLDPAYNHRQPPPPLFVPPPLQSIFIAAVYALRGAHDLWAVYQVQLALNLLAGLLVFWILLDWVGLAAAFVGLAGWMFYPEFGRWVDVPLTESNYFFWLLLSLWALTRWARGRDLRWAVVSAGLIGLANLQRPTALSLGLVLAGFALFLIPGRRRWLHALVFLLVPFFVLLPWRVRNERLSGDPVWVSSNGGILFYAVNNPNFDPLKYPDYGRCPGAVWHLPALDARFNGPEFAGRRTYYQLSELYFAAARSYILAHPVHFLKNNAIKLVQRFALVPAGMSKFYPALGLLGVGVLFYGLLGLGLAGFVAASRADWRDPTRQVLALSFAYYTFFLTLMHYLGDGRLTLPLRVFLLLFASAGLGRGIAWVCRRRTGQGEKADEAAAPSGA